MPRNAATPFLFSAAVLRRYRQRGDLYNIIPCHCEEHSDAISIIIHCHCETRLRVVAISVLLCHCEERSDVAISREGGFPQSSYPVHPIMGLPQSNFVLPRRDRKELSLRASETSDAISGRSPPLRHATRATSPVSSGEPTDRVHLIFVIARSVATWQSPGRVDYIGVNILILPTR